LDLNIHPFLTVMAIALVASLLSEIRFGTLRVPVVVWEMVFGILIGPYALGVVRPGGFMQWFGQGPGLAALFFMAGMELDLQKVKGRPLSLAIRGWILSLGLGLAAAAVLHSLPGIQAPMMVGLVLTTTALGTFMPILRDTGNLDSRFGSFVLAAGAAGEFAPIMVVSLVLTRKFGAWQEIALMLAFVAIAVGAALIALGLRPPRVLKLLERTMHSSTQLPVCLSLLLVASFVSLSTAIGFEAVLGAFASGMVVGLASRGEQGKVFRHKMEAICFGFLVPFFFVASGISLDLGSLLHSPKTMLLAPMFLILFLVVRGAPVILYRNDLPGYEQLPFALYSATALPMVVAITDIGVRSGIMPAHMAAAVVGAGLFSVLLFPTIAGVLLGKAGTEATTAQVV
jgi:Kef-type K+ transport system membrane component KefB